MMSLHSLHSQDSDDECRKSITALTSDETAAVVDEDNARMQEPIPDIEFETLDKVTGPLGANYELRMVAVGETPV